MTSKCNIPIHVTLLVTLFLNINQSLFASFFNFQNITTDNGLSHKSINCYLQDSKGYLWIGTTNGLNRYDGYQFKTFFKDSQDSLSLGGNIIYEMQEDKTGSFWLSTDAGFYRFSPQDESFHKINLSGVNTFKAQTISVDKNGTVWAINDANYLITINRTKNKQISLDSLLGTAIKNSYSNIKCIDNYIWLCSTTEIIRYDYTQNKAKRITINNQSPLSVNFIKKGVDKNSIVVIDAKNGIYTINTQNLHYTHIPATVFKSNSFDLFTITDAEYDNNGGLWVTAIPALFYISPSGRITRVAAQTDTYYNFDRIMSTNIYKDMSGNLWIGTLNNGVFIYKHKKSVFRHIAANLAKQKELPIGCIVTCNNTVYASNINAAYQLSLNENDEPVFSGFYSAPIMALSSNSQNELYLFKKDRVVLYNSLNHNTKELLQTSRFLHYGMLDSRGIYWVCYWGWGIEGFDVRRNKRYKIDIDTNNRRHNVVYRMCEDHDGSLWLGTFGTGLVHVQNPTSSQPKLTIYSHHETSNSIGHDVVLAIHDDQRGSLWLATNGGGLNRFEKKTKRFENFTTKNGLKNNVIEAVNSDVDGNIWFASTVLSKLDRKSGRITNFDLTDGMTSQYFTGASCRSADGTLFFGDDKGVISFNPREIQKKKNSVIPMLTDVKLFGQSINPRAYYSDIVPFPLAIDYSNSIELPYQLNSFSIDFASVQVLDNKNIEYSYLLEGIDRQWVLAGSNSRSANYSGIQPGSYWFKVRSTNGAGEWSNPRVIKITILPPWWKTFWFKIILSLVIIFLLSAILFFRIRALKRKNEILENLVKVRTAELQLKTDALNEQTVWLQQRNGELQEKQLVIEMKNVQLEDALQSKDKLIGIIAHDFKNPLSAIQGISELLFNKYEQFDSAKIRHFILGIFDASQNLQKQMTSVLEWAQSQVQELTCKPIEINIETIIDDSIELVKQNLQQKEISIATQLDYEKTVCVDPRMISTVLRNLLVNAIKFTPRRGSIMVVVQEYDTGVEVNVIDSGIGMSAETISQIFTAKEVQSSYGTESEKGVGFGLQICKNFVEQNKGSIHVTSTEGQGSVFSITLPKGKQTAIRKQTVVEMIPVKTTETFEIPHVYDKTVTILIVDDNPTIISLLKATFECYYSVLVASDGDSGLQIARNVIPTLIISDIAMPNKNGIELCELLKNNEMTNHIPIILLTAEKDPNIVHAAYANNVDDFIEKPFDKQLLVYKVKSLIENRKRLTAQKQLITDVKGFVLPENYEDAAIRRVLEYINNSFGSADIDVNTVAEAVGLSRAQLWRKFKSSTGYNLSDYIQKLRLEKAKEMLLVGKFKVAEVAYDVGFSNPNYFTRWFSQLTGESPTEFAEKNKK